MSADLDEPEHDLYEERGNVPLYLPMMQGDVFRDIEVPLLGEGPQTVQIVMHPCAMRNGENLNPIITVAPVTPRQDRIQSRFWRESSRFMPLPDLFENGVDFATRLPDMTGAKPEELQLDLRIAVLSQHGVQLLQQRMAYFMTRLKVDLPEIREQLSPIFCELEMQADWVDLAMSTAGDGDQLSAATEAERAFQGWLSEQNGRRRKLLQDQDQHASLRRQAHLESERRYRA